MKIENDNLRYDCFGTCHSVYRVPWQWEDYYHTLYCFRGEGLLIVALIKQLPKGYKVCLLKNEFGDLKGYLTSYSRLTVVDSELAKESNIDGVQEMLNGCLCCTLVILPTSRSELISRSAAWAMPCSNSKVLLLLLLLLLLHTSPLTQALITEKYNPARIIVETSGSAFPAPIAIQIRKLTRENEGIHLDSIITVVDSVHFRGYEVPPPSPHSGDSYNQ